jgi:fatty-acid desaturase
MSYHRLLTHRGYKTPKWVEYFLTVCATLALEGGPIFWVATHRIHHQYSDQGRRPALADRRQVVGAHGLDPDGQVDAPRYDDAGALRPRLGQRQVSRLDHEVSLRSDDCAGLILLAIGGLPFLMWGIFMRTVVGLHATWLVNSATHSWGTRRFTTRDLSTNSWWVALLTWGEGWHNNHHAHPTRRSTALPGMRST